MAQISWCVASDRAQENKRMTSLVRPLREVDNDERHGAPTWSFSTSHLTDDEKQINKARAAPQKAFVPPDKALICQSQSCLCSGGS